MTTRTTYTLRALAHLMRYPDATQKGHLDDLSAALHAERALAASRLAELDTLVARLRAARGLRAEADYVELFDRGRRTALHLFEHVHGDSRERGSAMIDLARTYEAAGLQLAPGELPDYLPVALEYASTQPPAAARAFLGEIAHILRSIFSALLERRSPYAAIFAALLELAGEAASPVRVADEPALDDDWAEPAAFDGCSSAGQASPGRTQPVRIVRKASLQGARS